MTQQGKILSFNEAKRTVKSRPSVSKTASGTNLKPTRRGSGSAAVSTASKKTDATKTSHSKPGTGKKPAVRTAKTTKSNKPKASVKNAKKVSPKTTSSPATNTEKKTSVKESQLSRTKRNMTKSKAAKQFSKQFGDTLASSANEGSRAALYKTEMGRQHKKASKIQNKNSKTSSVRSRFSLPRISFKSSPVALASLTVVIGLVFSCIFLYPAAQQYYLSVRDYEQAEAEYAAVLERNKNIETQVTLLSSEEGIKDKARAEYGWVKEGETAVTVHGLESEKDEVTYMKGVPTGSVEAPQTWYSPFFDFIFGVE